MTLQSVSPPRETLKSDPFTCQSDRICTTDPACQLNNSGSMGNRVTLQSVTHEAVRTMVDKSGSGIRFQAKGSGVTRPEVARIEDMAFTFFSGSLLRRAVP